MMVGHDALTDNLKEVIQKPMETPRTGPKVISMVLEDALNPRDEEGNLVWRFARSNKERLISSQQQHAMNRHRRRREGNTLLQKQEGRRGKNRECHDKLKTTAAK